MLQMQQYSSILDDTDLSPGFPFGTKGEYSIVIRAHG